jgi:hypothetical protein
VQQGGSGRVASGVSEWVATGTHAGLVRRFDLQRGRSRILSDGSAWGTPATGTVARRLMCGASGVDQWGDARATGWRTRVRLCRLRVWRRRTGVAGAGGCGRHERSSVRKKRRMGILGLVIELWHEYPRSITPWVAEPSPGRWTETTADRSPGWEVRSTWGWDGTSRVEVSSRSSMTSERPNGEGR